MVLEGIWEDINLFRNLFNENVRGEVIGDLDELVEIKS